MDPSSVITQVSATNAESNVNHDTSSTAPAATSGVGGTTTGPGAATPQFPPPAKGKVTIYLNLSKFVYFEIFFKVYFLNFTHENEFQMCLLNLI